MKRLLLPGLLALLPACSSEEATPGTLAQTPEELVRLLNVAVGELAARAEHSEPEVTIQHLLVAVAGGRVPGASRSASAAEALAAELFARARAGEDFDLLVKNHTDDEHPGLYVLSQTSADPPRVYARSAMPAGLDDVAFRLSADELGVVLFDGGVPDAAKSPFGIHLVKRLK